MKKKPLLPLALLLGLLLPGTSLLAADDTESVLTGAGAHFAWIVFDALKEDLEKKTGRKARLLGENSMLGVGCKAGIKAAKQNSLDNETFGFVCCPLSDEEIEHERLIVYPLAKEPILILTNTANPVDDLGIDQVRAIFRGEITNWKEVGGRDQAIVVVTRLHCKKRPGHWKTILPSAKAFRQQRINVKSAAAVVQRVSDFSGAIGHTGSTWLFKPEDNVKAISIGGVKPTAANLAAGTYPFFRQMSAITSREPSADVVKLIHEAQTGAAFQSVAKRFELLPLNSAR